MYSIIGADGREYGPATEEQLRQWISEGRVLSTTNARREGETDWKPLSAFPEFASAFPPPGQPAPPVAPVTAVPPRPALRSKLAAGLLGILLGAWGIHRFYLGFVGIGIIQILVTIFTCGIGALWGFIEGILILTGSIRTDAQGRPLQD